jgi:integrase/recombinase XerD
MTTSTIARIADIANTGRAAIIRAGFIARYSNAKSREHATMIIDQWYGYCFEHGLDPVDARRAHIEVWLRHLETERGLMASTVAGKLSAVRGLYKFALMDGYITEDPARWVQSPKVPTESSTEGLNRTEGFSLMEAAALSDPLDHAVICVLLLNGLRVGEMCSLQIEDITREGGYVVLNFWREKNVKKAHVPLMPRTSHAVDLILNGRTTGPLFLLRNEKPMDRRGADRIVKRIAKQAGITKRMHPHVLRHSFITNSMKAGASLRDVMNSVGHSSPRTTMVHSRSSSACSWVASSPGESNLVQQNPQTNSSRSRVVSMPHHVPHPVWMQAS